MVGSPDGQCIAVDQMNFDVGCGSGNMMRIMAAKGADGELLRAAFSAMEPGCQFLCDVCTVAAAVKKNADSCSVCHG